MRQSENTNKKDSDCVPFAEITSAELMAFIDDNAPRKVLTRVLSAMNHYYRAKKLVELDEEMGAIRLIAAEEELVVAIFEILKLKSEYVPEHRDFVRKFKNHQVKLAFYPTLSQFRYAVGDMLQHGFSLDGLEDSVEWNWNPVIEGSTIKLTLIGNDGERLLRVNPLSIAVSQDGLTHEEVVQALFAEFQNQVQAQQNCNLRQFLLKRADYRNKLLYAADGGSMEMAERLSDLIPLFEQSYSDLLWSIGVLVGNEPTHKHWGLVSQFISLYRLALVEVGALRDVG